MAVIAYIMSGDTSDFDGYVISSALNRMCYRYKQANVVIKVIIAVPERLACKNMDSQDPMEHDPAYAAEIVAWCTKILSLLAKGSFVQEGVKFVAGGLNEKNLFTAAKQFDELAHFVSPTRSYIAGQQPDWITMKDLAALITGRGVDQVLLDGNGSLGYLRHLREALGSAGLEVMGKKMKACGIPMPIMAGVLAEEETKTLRVKNRDPRATMNAIYSPTGVQILLDIARKHGVPLLFVTNNTCNSNVRFTEWEEVLDYLGISKQPPSSGHGTSTKQPNQEGEVKHQVLRMLAAGWYQQAFLNKNYVLYDWLCFGAMVNLLDARILSRPTGACLIEDRYLYVGQTNPEVLVIRKTRSDEMNPVERVNLEGTVLYGKVKFLVSMDRQELMQISRQLL